MSDETVQNGAAPQLRSTENNDATEKIAELNQGFKEQDIRSQAKSSGLKYVDLKRVPISHDAVQLTTWPETEAAQAIPFYLSGRELMLACVDPQKEETQVLKKKFQDMGYDVEVYLCSQEGIQSSKKLFDQFFSRETVEDETQVEEGHSVDDWKSLLNDPELWKSGSGPEMLNRLNLSMVQAAVSDVHLQPEEKSVLIRMRQDGVLHDVVRIDFNQYQLLDTEIMRKAGLKLNVKDLPQDGQYSFIANERKVNIRVSSLPSQYGESVVLRVLDQKKTSFQLEELGFLDHQVQTIQKILQRDHGLLLTTGPTGSGKSSTLYSCLQFVNQPEKKIITLEDPVEYEMENIIQSEISSAKNYSFSSGLRAILRHDPDIVMVGEMRDLETSETALQASMTGHLVLSTFHANDAISTVDRLLHMGIQPFILTAGLELIIAQRLVRKYTGESEGQEALTDLHQQRLTPILASLHEKGLIDSADISQVQNVAGAKYSGRTVIAEVLEVSEEMKSAILRGASEKERRDIAAKQSFLSLQEVAILKVLRGETTLEEVWKVIV